jgi:hypothetical protein
MGIIRDFLLRDYEIIDTPQELSVAVNRSIMPPSREVAIVGIRNGNDATSTHCKTRG